MAIGRDAVQREGKQVRQRIVVAAHVVACTLSSAGGELTALLPPDVRFDALIIDEVGLCRKSDCPGAVMCGGDQLMTLTDSGKSRCAMLLGEPKACCCT